MNRQGNFDVQSSCRAMSAELLACQSNPPATPPELVPRLLDVQFRVGDCRRLVLVPPSMPGSFAGVGKDTLIQPVKKLLAGRKGICLIGTFTPYCVAVPGRTAGPAAPSC